MNSHPTTPQAHPDPEKLIAMLYRDPTADPALRAHVNVCPECQAKLQEWEGVQRSLQAWRLPEPKPKPAGWQPAVKWGLAAALVLGLGITFGSLMPRSAAAVASLRSEIEASLTTNLVPVLRRQVRDEFAQSQKDMADQIISAVQAGRATDQEAILKLFQEYDRKRQADYALMRRDLETVAVLAEDRLLRTQMELGRLTVNHTSPTESSVQP